MRKQLELIELFDTAYSLLEPLLVIPGGMSNNNELFIHKFKPVFYIHYETFVNILASSELNHIQDFESQFVGRLFGIECYITKRPNAPKIALALESIDPCFATNNNKGENNEHK